MKRILSFMLMLLLCGSFAMAQGQNGRAVNEGSGTSTVTPAKFNYQAVLRHNADHDMANQLVRKQSGTATFRVGDRVIAENVAFTTTDNGMVSVVLESPAGFSWRGVTLTAVFTLDDEEITIETPVTAVPYAVQADNVVLTTAAIESYLNPNNTNGLDVDLVYQALKANSSVHDALRDTIVNFIKTHYVLAKEVAYHYMHQVTAADVQEAYAVGQSLDPEVKAAVYDIIKRYLKEHRNLLVEVSEYYISEATEAELQELYDALQNNLSAAAKVRTILNQYFESYLKRRGLWCDEATVCTISNLINNVPTCPSLGSTRNPLLRNNTLYLCAGVRQYDASHIQGGQFAITDPDDNTFSIVLNDVEFRSADAGGYEMIASLELTSDIRTATSGKELTITPWLYLTDCGDNNEIQGIPVTFRFPSECPAVVDNVTELEVVYDNGTYTAGFNFTGEGVVSGKYYTPEYPNGQELNDAMNVSDGHVTIAIPEANVNLNGGETITVEVSIAANGCPEIGLSGSYTAPLICPNFGTTSVYFDPESLYVRLSTAIDGNKNVISNPRYEFVVDNQLVYTGTATVSGENNTIILEGGGSYFWDQLGVSLPGKTVVITPKATCDNGTIVGDPVQIVFPSCVSVTSESNTFVLALADNGKITGSFHYAGGTGHEPIWGSYTVNGGNPIDLSQSTGTMSIDRENKTVAVSIPSENVDALDVTVKLNNYFTCTPEVIVVTGSYTATNPPCAVEDDFTPNAYIISDGLFATLKCDNNNLNLDYLSVTAKAIGNTEVDFTNMDFDADTRTYTFYGPGQEETAILNPTQVIFTVSGNGMNCSAVEYTATIETCDVELGETTITETQTTSVYDIATPISGLENLNEVTNYGYYLTFKLNADEPIEFDTVVDKTTEMVDVNLELSQLSVEVNLVDIFESMDGVNVSGPNVDMNMFVALLLNDGLLTVTVEPFLEMSNLACGGDGIVSGEPAIYPEPEFECGVSKVKDHQGNSYHTVLIGTQCWTKENMRCTTSPKGILTEGSVRSYYQPYYFNYSSSSIPLKDRGLLYNWAAAMDTVFGENDDLNVSFEGRRGICPEGWHVPSNAEWTTLTTYVSNNHACETNSSYNAKALATDNMAYWHTANASVDNPCRPDYQVTGYENNATGFSAVPSGYWGGGDFYNASYLTFFWSSSSNASSPAWYRSLYYNDENVYGNNNDKRSGYSVRCVMDEQEAPVIECPTVGATTITPAPATEMYHHNYNITTVINNYNPELIDPNTAKYVISYTVANSTEPITSTFDNAVNNPDIITIDNGVMSYTFYEQSEVTSITATPSIALAGDCGTAVITDCPTFVEESTTVTPSGTNTPTVMVINAQIQNYVGEDNVSVEHSGVMIKNANGIYIDTILAANNTTENPIPHIEISNAGVMTATIDCANYGTTFTVVPFIASYCVDGVVDYTYSEYFNVLGTPKEVTIVSPVEPITCGQNLVIGNNSYTTKSYGSQCWMTQNIREVPNIRAAATYYVNDNNGEYYYTWTGANAVCPAGWHLPDTAEWNTLTKYVSNYKVGDEYIYRCTDNANSIAKALAYPTGWTSVSNGNNMDCYPGGNSTDLDNATGFSALPVGSYDEDGPFGIGESANFWTATDFDATYSYYRGIVYKATTINEFRNNKTKGFSVRCVMDEQVTPTPTCGDNLNIGNNSYTTKLYGTQCWMTENIREASGSSTSAQDNDNPHYFVNNGEYYYNWPAAKIVCPDGWHLPTSDEWNTLHEYVSNYMENGEYIYRCTPNNANSIAKALASTTGWNTSGASENFPCETRYNPTITNNATEFSAIPAGDWFRGFESVGTVAKFWSATAVSNSSDYAYYFLIDYRSSTTSVSENSTIKAQGLSVRCVKGEQETPVPTCPELGETTVTPGTTGTTFTISTPVTNLTNVSNAGDYGYNAHVFIPLSDLMESNINEDVVFSHSGNAPVNLTTEELSISIDLYDYLQSTLPAVWAAQISREYVAALVSISQVTATPFLYMPNSGCGTNDTVYGVAATYPSSDCGTLLYNNHEYATVKIGNQCWTKENMREVLPTFTNGGETSNEHPNGTYSMTDPYFYVNGSNYLYNWVAAKAVCPQGWHLPTDADWTILESEFYNGDDDLNNSGPRGNHAGKMGCGDSWTSSNNDGAPGNSTECIFSGVAAGWFNSSEGISRAHDYAYFWSSTEQPTIAGNAIARILYYNEAKVQRVGHPRTNGMSVRCVKDND